MKLCELSVEYYAEAERLRKRIRDLKRLEAQSQDEAEQKDLHLRIHILTSIWRDTHEIACLTEHYYERGFYRNGRYVV